MITLSGRYTLNTRIRETPSADLYRGFCNSDGAVAVVKVLRDEYPSPADLARLRHEYSILSSLDLPQVVRALALEPFGHGLALVMDDAGEISLDDLLRTGGLSLERALQIAISVAEAVEAIHLHEIVHKDIKPHHLFLREDQASAVTLIDFGIAMRLPQQMQAAVAVAQLEGSLPYIAPEQTGRMNRVVDRRSDLYSIGVTLFQLFTGRLPFETTDPLELVHCHIARTPPCPHELRPDLPQVLSAIIQKLMAKEAEERYQSATGLRLDLERCAALLREHGSEKFPAFPLAQQDSSGELRIPQRLYGRNAELAELGAALERTQQGATELLLLSGPSGVGKSALVNELRRKAVSGCFVSGKFDYLGRGVPYAALARVCRELVELLLGEPPRVLAEYQRALRDALGPNAQIIEELVPNLQLVIGRHPPVPPLGPSESQHRFERTFQNFLSVFSSAGHPLVVFLDDLQWADAASLRLIQLLLDRRGSHLLLIGAYRDNEVDALHPLRFTLEELHNQGTSPRELAVEPLGIGTVTELLCDTLALPPARVERLASALVQKTQGNPFFLNQFLTSIYHQDLLRFDAAAGQWTWDLTRIEQTKATENVVEFMVAELRRLSPSAQELLRLAACIGDQFDARTLAVISRRKENDLGPSLWEALSQGLVIPLDGNYRYLSDAPETGDGGQMFTARYRFLHDRVQQAAYDLIGAAKKAEVHLSIGRLLLSQAGDDLKDDQLFTVVDHLNRGSSLISAGREKQRLAELNLLAGRKARDAAAPAAAGSYLDAALSLLGDAGWSSHYSIVFPAHLLKAEAEHLCRNPEQALRSLAAAQRNARNILDRLAARNLETLFLSAAGRQYDACESTVESLRLLGIEMPSAGDKPALGARIGAEFGGYQAALAGRSVESLADLPLMTDPTQLALMETLALGVPAAYQSNTELHVVLVLKAVAETLRHGIAPVSPFFYVQYAIGHMVITSDLATAFRFGQLGIDLGSRVGNPALAGPAHFVFGAFVSHWRKHLSSGLEHLRVGLRLCLELGDVHYASFAASLANFFRFYGGHPLEEIESEVPKAEELAQRTGDLANLEFCEVCRSAIRALKGQTRHLASFDRQGFDEAAFAAGLTPSGRAWYLMAKLEITYLSGNPEEALAVADALTPLPGALMVPEQLFYRALSLAELGRRAATPEECGALRDRLRADADSLRLWAESAPENFSPRHLLVLAESAALAGDTPQAMELYDAAIASAGEQRFLQVEAIANELCGKFHLAHHRPKVARCYLIDALQGYRHWGASAKAEQISAEYPKLVESELRAQAANLRGASLGIAGTEVEGTQGASGRFGGRLDLTTAIRATETLATELVFNKVLERLMRTLIENAGAQRGFLVLDRKGELKLEAAITIDPDTVRLGFSESLHDSSELSSAVVQYVARTAQPLLLADASRDPRFVNDPYVLAAKPKSILAIPMLHRAQLTGVLYLENDTATDAFSPGRAELLQFLAAQAAAAFENARLYGELHAASEELRQANESLEAQVQKRTEELRRALSDLWGEMDLARKIQTVLLPKTTRLACYDLAATMIPADSVGGDYYDVVETKNCDWILIGDVSGHGVSAGLVMMMIQTAVRAILLGLPQAEQISPASVLSRANAAVWGNLEKIGEGQYMTITALELCDGRIRYSGLHQDILVHRHATDSIERLETRGIWLGLCSDITHLLQDEMIELEPGDTLLLFTDGITELRVDGRMLGPELPARFHALASRELDPSGIVRGLLEPISGRAVADDITLMAIRYAPQGT